MAGHTATSSQWFSFSQRHHYQNQKSKPKIKTKISGAAFGLDLVALTSTPTVATSFTGTVKVELVDSSSGAVCSAWPTVQTLANQVFIAGEAGRYTVASIIDANAWKNLCLRVSYPLVSPTIVSCSADNFAIRPSTLATVAAKDLDWQTAGSTRTLSTITAPAEVTHKAGRAYWKISVEVHAGIYHG